MSTDWLTKPDSGRGMDLERAAIKNHLFHALARPMMVRGQVQMLTQCQLCGQPFYPGQDIALHELLLERDDVQGSSDEIKYKVLHDIRNLTLLCNEPCNIKLAKDDLFRAYLTARQIERYSADTLIAWINSLGLTYPFQYTAAVHAVEVMWIQPSQSSPNRIRLRTRHAQIIRDRLRSYNRKPMF